MKKCFRGTHEGHQRDIYVAKIPENDVKYTIFTRKHAKNRGEGHTRDTQGTPKGQKACVNSRNTCICLHFSSFSPDSVDSFLFQKREKVEYITLLDQHTTSLSGFYC